MGKMKNIME